MAPCNLVPLYHSTGGTRIIQFGALCSLYTFVTLSMHYKGVRGLGVNNAGSTMHSGSVKRNNFHSMINDTVIVAKVLNDAPA